MDQSTNLLPGRYVPKSGVLHKYPATEQCNLDDTDAEQKVETLADIERLPADTVFCQHCFDDQSKAYAVHLWGEMHAEPLGAPKDEDDAVQE